MTEVEWENAPDAVLLWTSLGRYLDLLEARGTRPIPMPASSYYQTDHWRRARAEALDRAGHHCALDARHAGPLVVHHNTYDRLWHEHPGDLVVLCTDCHHEHHKRHRAPRDVEWATERISS